MAFYNTCPKCGANLDPGESCDCEEMAEQARKEAERLLVKENGTGQMAFCWGEERRRA